jgi:hypothetical protein
MGIRHLNFKHSSFSGLVLLFIFLSNPVLAGFAGKVVGVTDGDTIKVLHNGMLRRFASMDLIALRRVRRSVSEQSS